MEEVGDNSEYPKLKVMLSSPENDNEEESVFRDSEYATESFDAQGSNLVEGVGFASLIGNPTPIAIETKTPIESVKDAVSKFGGIVDWKAHKVQTVERRKLIEIELEKAQEEIPVSKKECEAAEEEKSEILKNLEITNKVIEDVKLKLEREQIEEQEAKQDSERAKLKVEELEKGIDNEATISAKAQLEVAKARHLAAVAELKIVRDEFEKLQLEFSTLASDREAATKKAEEHIIKSKELETKIQDLTIEIANTKGSLESSHAEHLKEEEFRAGKAMEINQELLYLEKELKEEEEDLEKMKKETSPARELKSASTLLQSLEGELATYYMESKSTQENDDVLHSTEKFENPESKSHNEILAAIASARKELEKVEAHKEVKKAMEEANQEKELASSMECRLIATQKEIEASKYFEKYAVTSINNADSSNGEILYLEEYLELNQQAHEAKESEINSQQMLNQMKGEIIEREKALQIALQKAEIATEGKVKVEQQWRNMRTENEQRRKAGESVPVVENVKSIGQQSILKNDGQNEAASHQQRSPRTTQAPTPAQTHTQSEIEANYKEILSLETNMAKKKKKWMFPKFWMFMGKKKASS